MNTRTGENTSLDVTNPENADESRHQDSTSCKASRKVFSFYKFYFQRNSIHREFKTSNKATIMMILTHSLELQICQQRLAIIDFLFQMARKRELWPLQQTTAHSKRLTVQLRVSNTPLWAGTDSIWALLCGDRFSDYWNIVFLVFLFSDLSCSYFSWHKILESFLSLYEVQWVTRCMIIFDLINDRNFLR